MRYRLGLLLLRPYLEKRLRTNVAHHRRAKAEVSRERYWMGRVAEVNQILHLDVPQDEESYFEKEKSR